VGYLDPPCMQRCTHVDAQGYQVYDWWRVLTSLDKYLANDKQDYLQTLRRGS
jgi:hypothetical protein